MPSRSGWMWAAAAAALALAAGAAMAGAATQGDIRHGKAIAAGQPEIAAEHACSSCHGDAGEGNAESGIPRLAGQSQRYLLQALSEYADGLRKDEVMTPIAKALKEAQRTDVTA